MIKENEALNYLSEKPPFEFYDSSEAMNSQDSKMSGACCCCCCCCDPQSVDPSVDAACLPDE